MSTSYPSGTRLRCAQCGTEVILLKAHDPEVECCGQPMEPTFVPAQGGADGS
jgi:Desulfoferrodoxin, N-terminal domain